MKKGSKVSKTELLREIWKDTCNGDALEITRNK